MFVYVTGTTSRDIWRFLENGLGTKVDNYSDDDQVGGEVTGTSLEHLNQLAS